MPKRVQLRPLTTAEAEQLEKTARSRTAAVREVERSRVLLALAQQQRPEETAQKVGCAPATVYNILRRFSRREGLPAWPMRRVADGPLRMMKRSEVNWWSPPGRILSRWANPLGIGPLPVW